MSRIRSGETLRYLTIKLAVQGRGFAPLIRRSCRFGKRVQRGYLDGHMQENFRLARTTWR